MLYNIDWDFYEALLVQVSDRRLFVTYDEGVMEIMSPSYEHDNSGRYLAMLILVLAEELGLPLKGIRSTTIRRKNLRKGLEADEAFYLANADKIRGMKDLDFNALPPPDLAIEVEISTRLGSRVGIYAALGVPEIWRFSTGRLIVEVLQSDRTYKQSATSPTFSALPLDLVPALLEQSYQMDDVTWVQETRRWVRQHVFSQ